MRLVSSGLTMAAMALCAVTFAGIPDASAAGRGGGGFSGRGASGRPGLVRRPFSTVGRGYDAGSFGRGATGRGYGTIAGPFGNQFAHRRGGFWYGEFGYGYGGYGYGSYGAVDQGSNGSGSACHCRESAGYPTALGIRAAPVLPAAIYVIGGSPRRLRASRLGRPVPGASLASHDVQHASNAASGPRIIRLP